MICAAAMNSPPSWRYRTASDPMTPISESALEIGCVWATRLMAQKTAIAAKMKKISAVILFRRKGHHQAGPQQVEHRQRKHVDPGEAHELIVTEARRGGAHPDEQEQQHAQLGAEPEQRHQNGFENGNQQRDAEQSRDAQKYNPGGR